MKAKIKAENARMSKHCCRTMKRTIKSSELVLKSMQKETKQGYFITNRENTVVNN